MKHEDAQQLLGALALDELTGTERDAVAAHVSSCDACRRELEDMRAAFSLLGDAVAAIPATSLSSGRVTTVLEGIDPGVVVPSASRVLEDARPPAEWHVLRGWYKWACDRPALVAQVAATLAVVGVTVALTVMSVREVAPRAAMRAPSSAPSGMTSIDGISVENQFRFDSVAETPPGTPRDSKPGTRASKSRMEPGTDSGRPMGDDDDDYGYAYGDELTFDGFGTTVRGLKGEVTSRATAVTGGGKRGADVDKLGETDPHRTGEPGKLATKSEGTVYFQDGEVTGRSSGDRRANGPAPVKEHAVHKRPAPRPAPEPVKPAKPPSPPPPTAIKLQDQRLGKIAGKEEYSGPAGAGAIGGGAAVNGGAVAFYLSNPRTGQPRGGQAAGAGAIGGGGFANGDAVDLHSSAHWTGETGEAQANAPASGYRRDGGGDSLYEGGGPQIAPDNIGDLGADNDSDGLTDLWENTYTVDVGGALNGTDSDGDGVAQGRYKNGLAPGEKYGALGLFSTPGATVGDNAIVIQSGSTRALLPDAQGAGGQALSVYDVDLSDADANSYVAAEDTVALSFSEANTANGGIPLRNGVFTIDEAKTIEGWVELTDSTESPDPLSPLVNGALSRTDDHLARRENQSQAIDDYVALKDSKPGEERRKEQKGNTNALSTDGYAGRMVADDAMDFPVNFEVTHGTTVVTERDGKDRLATRFSWLHEQPSSGTTIDTVTTSGVAMNWSVPALQTEAEPAEQKPVISDALLAEADGAFKSGDVEKAKESLSRLLVEHRDGTQTESAQKLLCDIRSVEEEKLEKLAESVADEADLPPAPRTPPPPVNPFVMTANDPFSTFSLEADTASYTLARRYIRNGYRPPAGIVRMEEFINAFDYNYPSQSDRTFTVHAKAAPAPFGRNLTLLKVGVRGKVLGRDGRKPAHLVYVIDASGSMAREDRMPLVKYALSLVAGQLGAADRVTLVAFGTQPRLLLEATAATQHGAIRNAVNAIECGASTNILAGIELGYQLAARHFRAGEINRVVLCSDGVANVGPSDAEALLQRVDHYRRQGITFTSVGVGAGSYDDTMLEQLANKGDGNYVFIDSPAEAHRVFVEEMAATLQTIAKDVKIQVEFDPKRVRRYRLIGYENRAVADKDFRNDAIDAGEIGSGQSATALYELELLDDEAVRFVDLGTVYVRYKDVDGNGVEEISTRLSSGLVSGRTPEMDPRFFLGACVAEFAELLRGSEHARDGSLAHLDRLMARVANALPLDSRVQELLTLIRRSDGLPETR